MSGLCTLLAALIVGLLPELDALRWQKIPGELSFPKKRPELSRNPDRGISKSAAPSFSGSWSLDWLNENYEKFMSWDKNPLHRPTRTFGSHYLALKSSKDPGDHLKVQMIEQHADFLHQQLLKRYPELAVEMRHVAPERNGFLKFLELKERCRKTLEPYSSGLPVPMPESLTKFLQGEAWNSEAARSWLESQREFIDEVRNIGLLPERSVAGIDLDRWVFIQQQFTRDCADALLLDARLAAEEGNVERALASVQAAVGLADHIGEVETPSLIASAAQTFIRLRAQKQVLSEIMPHLPPGRIDVSAWQAAVDPQPQTPADFARNMTGEWNVWSRYYLLPAVADVEDPKYPPDPEALLDAYSGTFLEIASLHQGQPLSNLPQIEIPGGQPELSHLSRQSRETMAMLWIGSRAWRNSWERKQSATAMTQAAFAIMQGLAVPIDPVYGQAYRWNETTRELSPPDSPEFNEMKIKPIIVPTP